MRVILQPAFVLHRQPYRNSSLLVEILARDYGRIGLIARGVRAPRSRWRGLLEPFNALLLSWSGKGELFNLSAAEEVGTPISVPPGRILSGLYANELLLRLLQRHDPHPGLFKSYRRLLETLSAAVPEERALRIFEKHLLAEIGYGLSLETEVITGAPIFPQGNYRYVLDRGPVSAETTAVGIHISGSSLLALLYEDLTDPVILREVKRLTRAAIGKYLQGQPLRTREFCSVNCSRKRVR